MLKNYIVNGLQFQFEEGDQPAGAVEVEKLKQPGKAEEPETKEGNQPTEGGESDTEEGGKPTEGEEPEKAEGPETKEAPKPANKARKAETK